jgi:ribosomal protein S18 acetylase RimI-like enzyme
VVRRAGPNDIPFLRDMLRHAYYWRVDPSAELPVSRYVDGWGRKGDVALVAIDDFRPVGAAWYRLFSEENAGYGFVDEQTPELTVAVVPNRRGRGIGAELLTALLDQARRAGYHAVSLSVEPENPALHLYENHGFQKLDERGAAWTMVAPLDGGTTGSPVLPRPS